MSLKPSATASVQFGRFTLLPVRRELLANGAPVELGGRAFDVLPALVEARGAVLTKDELLGRVWPDRVVEENNLQVQIATLRKALAQDRDLIRTISERGYQFTGQVGGSVPAPGPVSPRVATNLSQPVSELIGCCCSTQL
jgi:DNA-binding winged helix-turn-helix (wHTH) protein